MSLISNPETKRIILNSGVDTNLLYCLKVSMTNADNGVITNTIIFPNMEYDLTFFDSTHAKLYTITALVEDVYEDQIKVKYLKNNNCKKCSNNTTSSITTAQGMPNCSCILNPPDLSKYEGPTTFFIPIMNILNVRYRWTPNNNHNDTSEVRVMLLGISATAVKAIIIRMAFFEDNLEEAVKLVDLKAGNIYDITYESNDGATYESRVKVMNIEECPDTPCKPGKGYVREHVGCGNSVYTNCACSKDEFMSAPPMKKIRIIVDTSESFTGRYEAIMLDAIRDCTLVLEADGSDDEEFDKDYCDCCEHKTAGCNHHDCGHYLPPHHNHNHGGCGSTMTYTYQYHHGACKAVITGDKVKITSCGKTCDINLEDLVKYYLGVE